MDFGKQIRSLRLRKSICQSEMAELLGVSAQAVSEWENGSGMPETRLLPRLAIMCGVTVDELFGFSDAELMERMGNLDWDSHHMDDFTFHRHADYLARKRAAEPYNAQVRIIAAQLYNHRAQADRDKAAASAREALEILPEDRGTWSALVSAMGGKSGDEWLDGNFPLIEYLMGFVGTHPGNLPALRLLVENLLAGGRFDEAEPFVKDFARIHGGEYMQQMYAGDIALAQGDRRGAIRKWESAAEIYRDDWRAHGAFARRLRRLGLFARALVEYEKSYTLQVPPRALDQLYARAMIFEQLGRYEEAIAERRRIIDALAENFGVAWGESVDSQMREIERLETLE